MLPDYISVIILSYDPFLLGDMYYEAKMHLATHPDYEYDDGRKIIFLYANGNPNFSDKSYGKRVQELLKYIVNGDRSTNNKDIDSLENIVSKVKSRSEVTVKYMRQIDYDRGLMRDAKTEALAEYNTVLRRLKKSESIDKLISEGFSKDVIDSAQKLLDEIM